MDLTVGGKRVRTSTGGAPIADDKPMIVFAHGVAGDRTVWSMVTRAFAHHGYSVLAVDLPGHGASEGPPLESVAAIGSWLIDLVEAAGFASAHLVGHSLGAAACLEAAALNPDRVDSLALLGTAGAMPVNSALIDMAAAGDTTVVDLMNDWGFARRSQTDPHPIPGMAQRQAGTRTMLNNFSAMANDLRVSDAWMGGGEIALKVSCPTLVVVGGRDRMVPPSATAELVEALPNATEVTIPEAGHMMLLERPQETIEAIRGHLAGV